MGRHGPEQAVERAVVRLAEKHGGRALKMNPRLYAGIPDRLVVLPGQPMFFVETKAPGGTPSKLQKRWHMLLHLIGHDVAIPSSVEAVGALFKEKLT